MPTLNIMTNGKAAGLRCIGVAQRGQVLQVDSRQSILGPMLQSQQIDALDTACVRTFGLLIGREPSQVAAAMVTAVACAVCYGTEAATT